MTNFDSLSENDAAVLRTLFEPLPGAAKAILDQQLLNARREREAVTMIELEVDVPSAPPLDYPDGPLPGRAFVGDPENPIGEMLLWVTGGYLSLLEYAWLTDDVPIALPHPGDIRFV